MDWDRSFVVFSGASSGEELIEEIEVPMVMLVKFGIYLFQKALM